MDCFICGADASVWVIERAYADDERRFEAFAMCDACRPTVAALARAEEARPGRAVAVLDLVSGPDVERERKRDDPSSGGRCARLLVGRGDDTYDPECALPRGHLGRCLTEREANPPLPRGPGREDRELRARVEKLEARVAVLERISTGAELTVVHTDRRGPDTGVIFTGPAPDRRDPLEGPGLEGH